MTVRAMKIFTEDSDTCAGTPDAVIVFHTDDCVESDCAGSKYGNYTYLVSYSCSIVSRLMTIAEAFSGSDEYMVVEQYKESNCSTLFQLAAYSFGTCLTIDGKISIQSTHLPNGSGNVKYYNNTDCAGDSYRDIKAYRGDSSQDCQYRVYKAYYLPSESSASGSSSSSASDVDNSRGVSSSEAASSASTDSSLAISSSQAASASSQDSEVTTRDGGTENSGINGGAIAGIVVAVLVVICAVIGFLWYWRRANKKAKSSSTDKPSDAYAQLTSPTTGQKSTDTGVTDFSSSVGLGPQSLAGLWGDEVIATWRIPREKVLMQHLINRGGYGEVYAGLYNGQRVALKMLLPDLRKSIKHVNDLLDEVRLLARLDHPRIVHFVGISWDSLSDLCVVLEFMEGGDLRDLLASYESDGREVGFDRSKVTIALHVAHALTYLHSLEPPVLHRDLKSKNILLTSDLQAKITDFGISRERTDKTMTAGVGTSLWMAPEVMMGERYGAKADVFSFGVVLSELDQHTLPYSQATDSNDAGRKLPDTAILQMVAMGKIRAEFSPGALHAMVSLGSSCVALDPKDRPTAAEALYQLQLILQQDL